MGKKLSEIKLKLFKTMAKMIRHDFGGIHDALNKMIIAEVKAALEQMPGKRIEWDGKTPLCHIVLSCSEVYIPREVEVLGAYIGYDHVEYDGLVIHGRPAEVRDRVNDVGILWYEDDTDWIDITDFAYLIDQIAEQVEGDATYSLSTMSLLTCGYAAELELGTAVEKTVTV